MILYHLSKLSIHERIACDGFPSAITPRIPKQSFGETETLRVCVAPTVAGCIYALPDRGVHYIYKIETEKFRSADKSVGGASISQECWITNEDLLDGPISIMCIGSIEVTQQLQLEIKVRFTKGEIAGRPTDELFDTTTDPWLFLL